MPLTGEVNNTVYFFTVAPVQITEEVKVDVL